MDFLNKKTSPENPKTITHLEHTPFLKRSYSQGNKVLQNWFCPLKNSKQLTDPVFIQQMHRQPLFLWLPTEAKPKANTETTFAFHMSHIHLKKNKKKI